MVHSMVIQLWFIMYHVINASLSFTVLRRKKNIFQTLLAHQVTENILY